MAEARGPGELDDGEVARLRARTAEVFGSVVADLAALVRIPSVSSPSSVPDVLEDSAGAVADLLAGAGLADVEVLRAPGRDGRPGAPAVVAGSPAPPGGAPRVLLYAHHDVQPPGEESLWTDPPFRPVQRAGRLYGRGAADDKAGIMAHVGALRVLGPDHGAAVTVFVEGEEEVGSPTFRSFLRAHADRLAADVIVVADSANWRVGVPALTTTLRGLVDAVVEVRVLEHAVHSGLYGGPVLDAVTLLARLLATLHDEQGEVAVAGLVRGDVSAPQYAEAAFRADASVLEGVRLAGSGSIAGRLWARPAVSVIGLDATPVDRASNTLAASARAKVSLRIAPGQDPAEAERALREHLLAHAPFGAQVSVVPGERGRPFAAPTGSPAVAAARWALGQAWGVPPVEVGIGGSIPFVADLVEAFPQAAVLVTGVEDPHSRAHGADESVHLGELERAVLAEALLIRRLGQGRAGEPG
jgi:acetylornithine deacetylase/succinyl-diaminopimelate desuccinylase-like protein